MTDFAEELFNPAAQGEPGYLQYYQIVDPATPDRIGPQLPAKTPEDALRSFAQCLPMGMVLVKAWWETLQAHPVNPPHAGFLRPTVEHWTLGPIAVLDCESTGIDPRTDRVVSISCQFVSPAGAILNGGFTTLVDPGIEIPEHSTAVHGITTEQAQLSGWDPARALGMLGISLRQAIDFRCPLVIFNARFDWPLVLAEAERHGLQDPTLKAGKSLINSPGVPPGLFIVDPTILDKWLDKWRKGGRTLAAMAAHYGVTLPEDQAHDAQADAIATADVLRAMARKFGILRQKTLPELHTLQVMLWREQRDDINAYWRKNDTRDNGVLRQYAGEWPVP